MGKDPSAPVRPLLDSNQAEHALLARPSIGIRTRLTLGFFSLFLLAASVTVAAWVMFSRLEVRLRLLEAADRYTMEIQQARRFEKNYLLYGGDLAEVRKHLERARGLLLSAQPEATTILTAGEFKQMQAHIDRYDVLLGRLKERGEDAFPDRSLERQATVAELRAHGAQMVSFAMALGRKERNRIDATILLFKRLPGVFLVVLLGLVVVIAHFLARQMLGPLTRLAASAHRIAQGDFSPMAPARWYRDEFSNLAVALNTMVRELSHRQEVLVQSHKLRAVGTLTAGVAHELNNPINNITLTAEMLKEDYGVLSDEERLDMVEDLVSEAERSQKIVRNLLDFARESEIHTERIDPADLLKKTARLAANQIKLSGAKIRLDLPDLLPPVHGDRQSLNQVFLNLLLNALDAVEKGGTVRISAEKARDPGYVRILVRDDGRGIPSHVLPYVFDPFFTTKSRGKGTGLGLSVSQGIVHQHGGEILVESKAGEGTTFTVLLPCAMVPETGGGKGVPEE